jgi:hypothetical protein
VKKPIPAPTQEDILTAIRGAIGPVRNDPGMTAYEYGEAERLTVDAARGTLERAVRAGRLVKGKAYRPVTDGRSVVQTVYRPA